MPWRDIIGLGAFDLNRVLEFEPEFLTDLDAEHHHDDRTSSVSVKFEGELFTAALEEWIGDLITMKGADLFRYKGVLAVKGMEQKFIFQGVGMLFAGGFNTIRWKPDEKRECRFVFIGRNLDKKALVEGVEACKARELRFEVGDLVWAKPDPAAPDWTAGKIWKHWDEGQPYVIELDDGEKVYVGMDDEKWVKKRDGPEAKKRKVDP